MNVISTCYPDHLDKVVFVGDAVDFSIWYQRFPQNLSINIVSLAESEIFERHKRLKGVYKITEDIVKKLRYPARIFIIFSSLKLLNQTLEQGKRSVLWNAEATFFIVLSNLDENCSSAKNILHDVWSFNALYAFYICGIEDTLYFYSFNPFSAYALESWETVDSINDTQRHHPIVIFRFLVNYTKITAATCATLSFTKTSILGEYPVALTASITPGMLTSSSFVSLPIKGRYEIGDFEGIDAKIGEAIWPILGGNPYITIFKEGYVDPLNHEPRGSFMYIMRGEYDISLNQNYFRSFWKLETYPHGDGGTCVMMKETTSSVAVISMSITVEPRVMLGIIVGVALAVVLLKYLVEIDWVAAVLKVLKMLLGMPTKHHPPALTNLSVVYLILLLNSINLYLQTNLTSSLAVPPNTFYIDTRGDLISAMYNYDIYGPTYVKEFLDDDELIERFVEMSMDDCIERLEIDVHVTCVCDCFLINHHAKTCRDCHISKHYIQNNLLSFIHREDWPLKARFNTMVQRLSEAGVITHILKDELTLVKYHRKMHEINWNDREATRKITLKALMFSFYALLAGTVMAGLTFLGEIAVQWKGWSRRRRINKIKLRNLRLFNY